MTDNLRVEPNHVYVIPPNKNLSISAGVLTLRHAPRHGRRIGRSIFSSTRWHSDQRDCAIGVILSGTASDGTLGLEAIKAEGGITFAQDDSARYDSMPRNAVAAGSVDLSSRLRTCRASSLVSRSTHGRERKTIAHPQRRMRTSQSMPQSLAHSWPA